MVWSIRRIRFGIRTCLLEEHMCSHRMRVILLIRLEDFGYSLTPEGSTFVLRPTSGLRLRDSNRTRTKKQKSGLGQTWARCRSSRWDWFANSPDALASKVTNSLQISVCPTCYASSRTNVPSSASLIFIHVVPTQIIFTVPGPRPIEHTDRQWPR